MRAQRTTLAIVFAILVGEGYFLADRYVIPHVPLQFADWSRHVLTLDEQRQLFEELRVELMGVTDASSGVVLSGLIRSISEPRRVCGLLKHKGRNGLWRDWNVFAVTYSRYGVFVFAGINRGDDYKGTLYPRDGVERPLQQNDRVECEPVSPCEMCFSDPPKVSNSKPEN